MEAISHMQPFSITLTPEDMSPKSVFTSGIECYLHSVPDKCFLQARDGRSTSFFLIFFFFSESSSDYQQSATECHTKKKEKNC